MTLTKLIIYAEIHTLEIPQSQERCCTRLVLRQVQYARSSRLLPTL